MNYQRLAGRLMLLLATAILGGVISLISAAAPATRLELVSAVLGGCSSDTVTGSLQIAALDDQGNIVNSATALDFRVVFTSNSGIQQFTTTKTASQTAAFAVQFPGAFTTAAVQVFLVSDPSIKSALYTLNCDDLTISAVAAGDGDGRLNPNAGDLINVLYVGFDSTGNLAIDVYTVEGDSGKYFGQFPYKLFQPYLSQPPATNTKLATLDQSTLYALVSGEFQIDVGPDAQGKVGKVIFSFPPKNIRAVLSDPGEQN